MLPIRRERLVANRAPFERRKRRCGDTASARPDRHLDRRPRDPDALEVAEGHHSDGAMVATVTPRGGLR